MTAGFTPLPPGAAWRHSGARVGFETVFFDLAPTGARLHGHTAALEGDEAWWVGYDIRLDERWATRHARVWGRSPAGEREVTIEADGTGHWWVGGDRAPALDGCLDVDLESSACTNTLPVHRLALPVGRPAEVPAAYVRAVGLGVERLEQTYARAPDAGAPGDGGRFAFDYRAPAFGFSARLAYDASGLVLTYPGIAVRAG